MVYELTNPTTAPSPKRWGKGWGREWSQCQEHNRASGSHLLQGKCGDPGAARSAGALDSGATRPRGSSRLSHCPAVCLGAGGSTSLNWSPRLRSQDNWRGLSESKAIDVLCKRDHIMRRKPRALFFQTFCVPRLALPRARGSATASATETRKRVPRTVPAGPSPHSASSTAWRCVPGTGGLGRGSGPWFCKSRGPDGARLCPCCCVAVALSTPPSGVQPDTLSCSTGGIHQLHSENPQELPRVKAQLSHGLLWPGPIMLLNISCLLHGLSSQCHRMCPTLRHLRALAHIVPSAWNALQGPTRPAPPYPAGHPVSNANQPAMPACLLHEAFPDPSQWLNEFCSLAPRAPYLCCLPGT